MNAEVPTAAFTGTPISWFITGTITTPPPTPSIPESTPAPTLIPIPTGTLRGT